MQPASADQPESPAARLKISSQAFQHGQAIPRQHTGDGKDVSPPLSWTGSPEKTASFALVCDDPDAPAGTWVHWILYDLPGSQRELKEAVPGAKELAGGARQGTNSGGKIGYSGPSPPAGKPHRYFFKLYALDTKLGLKPGADKKKVLEAMKGHILEESEIMGTYQRP